MERKKVCLFLPLFAAFAIFAGSMLYADVDVVAEGGRAKAAAGIDREALKAEIMEELRAEMLSTARAEIQSATVPEVSQAAISSAVSSALEESGILSGLFKGTTVSGYLDTIFSYNLRQHGDDPDRALTSGLGTGDINGWNYLGERNDDTFALESFAIFFDKATTDEHPIGWQAHLYFGEKAKRITFLGAGGFQSGATSTGTDDTARNDIVTIATANITWDAPVGGRTVPITMGKMYTWIGYELVENIGNPNYSHGFIYNNAIPFTHMGMSFDVSEFLPSDKLGLQLKYVNGWDSFIDNNKSKTFGMYLTYQPNDDFFISLATIWGNEGWNVRETGVGGAGVAQDYTSLNNGGLTQMYDIVATYALPQVEKLSLGFNFDWGLIEDFNAHDGASRPEDFTAGSQITGTSSAHWWAIAGYAMYDFTDRQMGALRYEYMDDQDHARTFGYSIWDLTYTHNITVAENLMIRPEIRYIKHNTIEGDNEPAHGDTDGGGTLNNDSETILTLGVEYVF